MIISVNLPYTIPICSGVNIFETVLCDGQYRAYRKNRPFGPGVYKALHDIRLSQLNGNMASMYADAKIREILSLFLAGQEEENYLHCSCTIGIKVLKFIMLGPLLSRNI